MAFTALYDSCVFYPAPLRDLLVELATTGLFRARWTERIHGEWMRNLLDNRPDLDRQRLDRTRELIDLAVPDCLVKGYESLIDSIEGLPDPDDRHVVAASLKGRADVIVTFNLKDFPLEVVFEKYHVEPQHPDTFICHVIDLDPGRSTAAVRAILQRLVNPRKTEDEYLDVLLRQGLPQTVLALRNLL